MKEYTQVINGISYTFLLDAEDAARRGLGEADLTKAAQPQDKARTPSSNKSG